MPWKKSEPMEERIEFGLRAVRNENFRALCREYGITAGTGYKGRERMVRWGTERGRGKNRVGRTTAQRCALAGSAERAESVLKVNQSFSARVWYFVPLR